MRDLGRGNIDSGRQIVLAIRINTVGVAAVDKGGELYQALLGRFRRDAADQEPGVVCQWTAAAFSAESETYYTVETKGQR